MPRSYRAPIRPPARPPGQKSSAAARRHRLAFHAEAKDRLACHLLEQRAMLAASQLDPAGGFGLRRAALNEALTGQAVLDGGAGGYVSGIDAVDQRVLEQGRELERAGRRARIEGVAGAPAAAQISRPRACANGADGTRRPSRCTHRTKLCHAGVDVLHAAPLAVARDEPAYGGDLPRRLCVAPGIRDGAPSQAAVDDEAELCGAALRRR